MITSETIIEPINLADGKVAAVDIARALYEKWNKEAKKNGRESVSFAVDLADYTRNGLVIARADIFGMAKLIKWKGDLAWFVRMAVGDLCTLIAEFPLPTLKVCFCRKGDPRIRAYTRARLIELATRKERRTQ